MDTSLPQYTCLHHIIFLAASKTGPVFSFPAEKAFSLLCVLLQYRLVYALLEPMMLTLFVCAAILGDWQAYQWRVTIHGDRERYYGDGETWSQQTGECGALSGSVKAHITIVCGLE